nr:hypothetical protein CFP56_50839 [Quercus suber]
MDRSVDRYVAMSCVTELPNARLLKSPSTGISRAGAVSGRLGLTTEMTQYLPIVIPPGAQPRTESASTRLMLGVAFSPLGVMYLDKYQSIPRHFLVSIRSLKSTGPSQTQTYNSPQQIQYQPLISQSPSRTSSVATITMSSYVPSTSIPPALIPLNPQPYSYAQPQQDPNRHLQRYQYHHAHASAPPVFSSSPPSPLPA